MRLEKYKKPVDYLIAGFSITVMVVLVICVVWQVFSRYVLNNPSTITDELARFSMIWVGLLGAAYTTGAQRHLSIDLLNGNLSGVRKMISQVVINLCILGFCALAMVWGGSELVEKVYTTGQVSPAMQIPMAYVYAVLPLSGLIMMFYAVIFILEALLEHHQPAQQIIEERA